MTLLDKVLKGAFMGMLLSLVACQDPNDINLELDPGDSETRVFFENFSLDVSTVYIDSLRTDEGFNLLVGANQDTVYGDLTVQSFTEILYSTGTVPSDTLELVEGEMYLEIPEILTSNTFVDQTLEVRLFSESIFNSAIYLADESLTPGDSVFANWPLVIGASDSLISVELGLVFEQLLWSRTQNASNIADLDFGIALTATDPNGGLAAIDLIADSTFIVLTSRDSRDTTYTTTYRFGSHFANIERDRSGSRLASLNTTGDTESGAGTAYMNALAGSYVEVDIDPLKSFIQSNENILINGVTVEIPLTDGRVNNLSEPVEAVNFYYRKDGNVINGPGLFTDIQNNVLAPEEQYSDGRLQLSARIVELEEDESGYNEPLTLFSQFALNNNISDAEEQVTIPDAFVLVPLNRLTLKQSAIQAGSVELSIFYTVINQ